MEREGVFKEPGGIPTRWDFVDGHFYVQTNIGLYNDGVPARSARTIRGFPDANYCFSFAA